MANNMVFTWPISKLDNTDIGIMQRLNYGYGSESFFGIIRVFKRYWIHIIRFNSGKYLGG